MYRKSSYEYELESLGINQEQIKKIMIRLSPESLPNFIRAWKDEMIKKKEEDNHRIPDRHQVDYVPRMTPQISKQRSSQRFEEDFQSINQNRAGIEENLDMMAYRFFGEPENGTHYTYNNLDKIYRKLALALHPDRNNGDSKPFFALRKAYEHARRQIPLGESDSRPSASLGLQRSVGVSQNRAKPPPKHLQGNNKSFDSAQFNSYFEENALPDEHQKGGYDEWFRNHKEQENFKANKGNFNEVFEKSRRSCAEKNNSLIVQKGPPDDDDQLNGGITQLGMYNVKDYSGKSGSIQYTDLKRAHETPHLYYGDDEIVEGNIDKEFSTAQSRNRTLPEKYTESEFNVLQSMKDSKLEEEQLRQYRQQEYDERITHHFQDVANYSLER